MLQAVAVKIAHTSMLTLGIKNIEKKQQQNI